MDNKSSPLLKNISKANADFLRLNNKKQKQIDTQMSKMCLNKSFLKNPKAITISTS